MDFVQFNTFGGSEIDRKQKSIKHCKFALLFVMPELKACDKCIWNSSKR